MNKNLESYTYILKLMYHHSPQNIINISLPETDIINFMNWRPNDINVNLAILARKYDLIKDAELNLFADICLHEVDKTDDRFIQYIKICIEKNNVEKFNKLAHYVVISSNKVLFDCLFWRMMGDKNFDSQMLLGFFHFNKIIQNLCNHVFKNVNFVLMPIVEMNLSHGALLHFAIEADTEKCFKYLIDKYPGENCIDSFIEHDKPKLAEILIENYTSEKKMDFYKQLLEKSNEFDKPNCRKWCLERIG